MICSLTKFNMSGNALSHYFHGMRQTAMLFLSIRTLILHALCLLAISYSSGVENYWILTLAAVVSSLTMLRYQFILHEACHGVVSSHRPINECIGRLAGMLCGYQFEKYRINHSIHHRYAGTAADTELANFINNPNNYGPRRRQMISKLLSAISGLDAIRLLSQSAPGSRKEKGSNSLFKFGLISSALGQCALLGVFATGMHYFQAIFVFGVSVLCGTFFLNRVRAISEHAIDESLEPFDYSKTHIIGGLGKLISPLNFNYHYEHHLFPEISSYYYPAINLNLTSALGISTWCRKGFSSSLYEYWTGTNP